MKYSPYFCNMQKHILSFIFCLFTYLSLGQFVQVNKQALSLNNQKFEVKSVFFENTSLNGTEFFNGLYQNFDLYTLEDYKQAKELGFNTVELELVLPILKNQNAKQQVEWLKKQVEWAKSQDVKLILSLHGAIQAGKTIWNDEKIRQHTIDYWQKIATLLKDDVTILGYKLLENPKGQSGKWKKIAGTISQQIRTIDNKHVIIIEQKNKPFFTLDDRNTLYHFSFVEPSVFTQQSSKEGVQKYPDNSKHAFPTDLEVLYIDTNNTKFNTGEIDWTYYESKLFYIPDSIQTQTTVGSPILSMSNSPVGSLYFGEFIVEEVSPSGISEEIFRVQPYNVGYWQWYGQDQKSYFKQIRAHGRDNRDVLSICYANRLSYCYNSLLRFPVKKGYFYKVSGWIRGDDISFEALNCFGLMIEQSPNNLPVLQRNAEYLKFYFQEYTNFQKEHNVPIYIELKMKHHVYKSNRGGKTWMNDMLQTISENTSGYSYHNYLSKEFGIYSLKKKGRKENKNAFEYFQEHKK